MSLWTRRQGYRRGTKCTVCRANEATRLCDGVVRGARWALCSKPICEACVTRHGASEFCTACALLRGYITREPGEDDR